MGLYQNYKLIILQYPLLRQGRDKPQISRQYGKHITDEEFKYRIYKERLQLNKKTYIPILKINRKDI